MTAPQDIIGRLRAALDSEGAPVSLAVLFGSVAKGKVHAGSDVDVAVVMPEGATLNEELALEARLGAACGRDVQLVALDGASDLLRWQIAKHGILLKGERSEFLRFVVAAAREHADQAPLRQAAGASFRKRLASGDDGR